MCWPAKMQMGIISRHFPCSSVDCAWGLSWPLASQGLFWDWLFVLRTHGICWPSQRDAWVSSIPSSPSTAGEGGCILRDNCARKAKYLIEEPLKKQSENTTVLKDKGWKPSSLLQKSKSDWSYSTSPQRSFLCKLKWIFLTEQASEFYFIPREHVLDMPSPPSPKLSVPIRQSNCQLS